MKKILSTSLTIIFGLWLVVFSSYGIASATGPVYPQSPFTKSGNDILTRNVLDGIGSTTTPLAYLHVDEAHINNYLDFTGVLGSGIDMGNFSITNANLISASYFNATGTSATSTFSGDLIVDGNVGIGETSPTSKLHIDNTGIGRGMFLDNTNTGLETQAFLIQDASTVGGNQTVKIKSARTGGSMISALEIEQDGSSSGIRINQNGNGKALNIDSESTNVPVIDVTAENTSGNIMNINSMLVLDYAGKVGIATTTPAMELDVAGMMRAYKTSTSTCDATLYGAIFYHQTDDIFWGCKSSGWSRLDN